MVTEDLTMITPKMQHQNTVMMTTTTKKIVMRKKSAQTKKRVLKKTRPTMKTRTKGKEKKKKSLTAKGEGDDEEKGQLALTDGVAGEEGSVAVGSLASIPNGLDGASSSADSPDKSKEGRGALVKIASSNETSTVGGASGTTTVRSRTKEWNAEIISPVFFGYAYVEEKQHDEAVLGEKAALRVAEERAVQRTKANRAQLLDEFEIAMKNQHANRTKKINKLQDEYDKARTKREEDLRRFQAELPPVAFNAYKATWELEYLTAEEAFDAEIGKMNDFHEKQCAADFETVQKRRDELEAFKDAESQVSLTTIIPPYTPSNTMNTL